MATLSNGAVIGREAADKYLTAQRERISLNNMLANAVRKIADAEGPVATLFVLPASGTISGRRLA